MLPVTREHIMSGNDLSMVRPSADLCYNRDWTKWPHRPFRPESCKYLQEIKCA